MSVLYRSKLPRYYLWLYFYYVTSEQVLARWLSGRPADEVGMPFTFVVGLDGQLLAGAAAQRAR
jgi:hypothetical protein